MKEEGFGGGKRRIGDHPFGITNHIAFVPIAMTTIILYGLTAGGYALTQSEVGLIKEPLIKASYVASLSFWRLSDPIFPHLSSNRLRKIDSEIHPNCLRFRHAPFNQRFLKSNSVIGYYRCETLWSGVDKGWVLAVQGMGKTGGQDFRDQASLQKGDSVIRAVRYLTLGSLVGIALLMVRANRAKRNRRNEQDE